MVTYESIRNWKDHQIANFQTNASLNSFHDKVMLKIVEVALSKMTIKPPCDFAWFITGSGGRFEQGIISDQDHGIIYDNSNEEADSYFHALGVEISYGMNVCGYPYCKGNIMSSNPTWCKSIGRWKEQLQIWMETESWESIRYLQIFYDARLLFGNGDYIYQLKSIISEYRLNHPQLLIRFVSNMKHLKNGIGPMGQIIVEQHGVYQGCVDIKYAAFLPYVNSIRLLSIREGIYSTSTLDRMKELLHIGGYQDLLKKSEFYFCQLLNYRFELSKATNYDATHYLNVKNMSKEDRKQLKQIIKDGRKLRDEVIILTLNSKPI